MGDRETEPEQPSRTEPTSPLTDAGAAVFYAFTLSAFLLLAILFFSLLNLHGPTIALTHITLINSTHNASISFCLSVTNPGTVAELRYRRNSIAVHFFSDAWSQQDVASMLPAEARVVAGGTGEVLCTRNDAGGRTRSGSGGPRRLVHVASWARLDGELQVYGFIPMPVTAFAYCWTVLSSLNSTDTGTAMAARCTAY